MHISLLVHSLRLERLATFKLQGKIQEKWKKVPCLGLYVPQQLHSFNLTFTSWFSHVGQHINVFSGNNLIV